MSHRTEVFLNVDCVSGTIPDEARFVRRLGCPDTRQFDVLELGGMLMVREVGNGDHVARIGLAELFNKMAVAVLKHNDGERYRVNVAQGAGDAVSCTVSCRWLAK